MLRTATEWTNAEEFAVLGRSNGGGVLACDGTFTAGTLVVEFELLSARRSVGLVVGWWYEFLIAHLFSLGFGIEFELEFEFVCVGLEKKNFC